MVCKIGLSSLLKPLLSHTSSKFHKSYTPPAARIRVKVEDEYQTGIFFKCELRYWSFQVLNLIPWQLDLSQPAPWLLAPWQLAQWRLAQWRLAPGQLAPWTARPMDTSPNRQLAPWTARPMDNLPHSWLLANLYFTLLGTPHLNLFCIFICMYCTVQGCQQKQNRCKDRIK